MNVLDIAELRKSYGPTRVLDGVGFTLGEAEKVGVVGRNGCGKTTLFRLLAGLEDADGGRVVRRRGLTVGYLPQRPVLDPAATVRQVLEGHLGEARERLGRHRELGEALARARGPEVERLLAEQQEVHSWLDHHGAWTLDHRVEEMCTRFGLTEPDARVGTLSGGWAQRVALAGILLRTPDLLILDEPTNQIDADTVAWLEEHLLAYPGAVLLVTHDRYFLDRVVSRMLELEGGALTAYQGGYSAYLEQKAERLAQQESAQARLLNLLRREEAWLARGAKARTTKQKARIGRVEDLRGQQSGPRARDLALDFDTGATPRLGGTILEAEGLGVAVGGRPLVRGLTFALRKGERVGILGPNGCGKTSLVRTLLGQLPPAAGSATVGKNTLVGYLDQHRTGLEETATVAETLGEGDWVLVGGPRGERRHKVGYLEDFLFPRDDQRKPVCTLSGGERARLLLARLLLQGANVLVLDEPTNDLDIPTLQVLDEALAAFPGAALVVTHDRYFLDRVATGILHFEAGGQVAYYEGNYEVFTRLRARAEEEAKAAARAAAPRAPAKAAPKPRAALTWAEERELQAVEAEIAALEGEKADLEARLANPAALPGGHRALEELARTLATLTNRLEDRLERWAELEEKR